MALDQFHPAVSSWFQDTFSEPTSCQQEAWPAIKKGTHTLIAAPTGSGKTLAAFLASIDNLVWQGIESGLSDQTQILYVSPLKALSNDIRRNLEGPLEGIGNNLFESGYPDIVITAMVRTGDTTAAARVAMKKKPPHILVTTPESLYILLTSESGRNMLTTVRSVIVDEIHAVVGSKRGSHLALSLERLQHLTGSSITRIGLSATQRPIEEVAKFLVGSSSTLEACQIIDSGHKRQLDLAIETPTIPLEALLSGDAASEIYDRIANLIHAHNTTLIFVNTRRMAERIARHLSERIGEENITSHHGSLAREQRLSAEARLKEGSLKALVATASLELGIDIGDIDLVCQIGSTRSIATLLQRVGRSGHSLRGVPKGRLFPTSRDDLIECIALIVSVRQGELDQLSIPQLSLDVLAQQIVAMVASEEWNEDALFSCLRGAYPYRSLSRKAFDDIIIMLAEGFSTQRGRRAAYLYRDSFSKQLRPRRGARLTAITCGGAIPDNADYRVILEPNGDFIGTVDEDFAIESLSGDIFQLGNTSWRILRIETNSLRVEDAKNQPPNIPFWFGEAPGRTWELSEAVSELREKIADLSEQQTENGTAAMDWLTRDIGIGSMTAQQTVNYIAAAKKTLTAMPGFKTLVLERFFDESGGMQLILHTPFGSRVNRAWGLALRKRFCRSFNFELQAAATENAVILSLSTSQSFPLESVAGYLNSKTVREILIQAMLDAPMFTIRWRWNATCALAIKRFQNGKKTQPYLLRMQAEDLVTSIFPDQLACLENISGDREIPDHPLIKQAIDDCLHEAMDIERLESIIRRIENRQMNVVARDVVEPSPFAAEILTASNYAFLDGAPAEERRTRAVTSRRWLDPATASDLGKLDLAAIDRVKQEAWPFAQTEDELHDAINIAGFIDPLHEINHQWIPLFETLVVKHRVTRLFPKGSDNPKSLWIAAERIPQFKAIFPDGELDPDPVLPSSITQQVWQREDAILDLLRARMSILGPTYTEILAESMSLNHSEIDQNLIAMETEGYIMRGSFTGENDTIEWCERRLLARIHRYTINRLRNEIEPVTTADFIRFLCRWQHVHPEYKMEGSEALAVILDQLEGFEAAASSWEKEILPSRIKDYDHRWLDTLCSSGKYQWFRLTASKSVRGPIKSSPIALVSRRHVAIWLNTKNQQKIDSTLSPAAEKIKTILAEKGALFYEELTEQCGMLRSQLETTLAELVSSGFITSDSFIGLRALLLDNKHRHRRLKPLFALEDSGRWSLIKRHQPLKNLNSHTTDAQTQSLERITKALLNRYGVLFRSLLARETAAPSWGQLLPILRQMEARGDIRGGRFVSGQYGEHFALPEAVETLRAVRRDESIDAAISISAADPLNLVGILTPGDRVPSTAKNRILFEHGIPVASLAGKETHFLGEIDEKDQWATKQKLIRHSQ